MTDRLGFLLVDKASGWTSHDVVARVRSTIGVRKVGHAGTLDPMATGLLVVGFGRATRLLRFVQDAPKTYVATARLGVATDTLDADGAVLSREPLPVSADEVDSALRRFVGEILQVPPMVSARRVEGRRLYELAREGKTVEREARPVMVYSLTLLDFAPSDYPEATFRVECGSGTYVRTLADDVARALGGRAHLTALRRTAIGSLSVDDAVSVDEIARDGWESLAIDVSTGLAHLPPIILGEELARAVLHGVTLGGDMICDAPAGMVRIVDESGNLLAVYNNRASRATAEVVLS